MNAAENENEDLNEIADTFKEDELIHFGETHRAVVGVKTSHVDEVCKHLDIFSIENIYEL